MEPRSSHARYPCAAAPPTFLTDTEDEVCCRSRRSVSTAAASPGSLRFWHRFAALWKSPLHLHSEDLCGSSGPAAAAAAAAGEGALSSRHSSTPQRALSSCSSEEEDCKPCYQSASKQLRLRGRRDNESLRTHRGELDGSTSCSSRAAATSGQQQEHQLQRSPHQSWHLCSLLRGFYPAAGVLRSSVSCRAGSELPAAPGMESRGRNSASALGPVVLLKSLSGCLCLALVACICCFVVSLGQQQLELLQQEGLRRWVPPSWRVFLEERRLLDGVREALMSGAASFYLSRILCLSLGEPTEEEALALLEGMNPSVYAVLAQRGPLKALPPAVREVYYGGSQRQLLQRESRIAAQSRHQQSQTAAEQDGLLLPLEPHAPLEEMSTASVSFSATDPPWARLAVPTPPSPAAAAAAAATVAFYEQERDRTEVERKTAAIVTSVSRSRKLLYPAAMPLVLHMLLARFLFGSKMDDCMRSLKKVAEGAVATGFVASVLVCLVSPGRLTVNRKLPDDAFVSSNDGLPDVIIKGRNNRGRAIHGELVQIEARLSCMPLPYPLKACFLSNSCGRDFRWLRQYFTLLTLYQQRRKRTLLVDVEQFQKTQDKITRCVLSQCCPFLLLLQVLPEDQWLSLESCADASTGLLSDEEDDATKPGITRRRTGRVVAVAAEYLSPKDKALLLLALRQERRSGGLCSCRADRDPEGAAAVREWTALFAVFVAGVVSTISLSCRRDTRSRGKQRRAGNRAEGVRRVFTIDPPSARDLDDAVHIHRVVHADGCPLATGLEEYEVGIHIADVSHFIAQDGEMDKEAKTRCATLLHPGGPKLTFSVIARFFADGTPNKRFCPYFFKSVIESCCRFSYDEVQELIDGNEIAEQQQPTVAPEIKGTASWGNTILRCSCCTGKTNRSKQQQQDEEQLQGPWEEHAAADTWGDSLKRSADADFDALPNSSPAHHEQQKQQQQRPQLWGSCCCCERRAMQDASEAFTLPCTTQTWDTLVADLRLLDRLTANMRSKRFKDSSPFEVHSAELRFSFDALQRPMGWELETVRHDLICFCLFWLLIAAFLARTYLLPVQYCRLIADSAVMRTHPPFKQDERLSSFIKSLKPYLSVHSGMYKRVYACAISRFLCRCVSGVLALADVCLFWEASEASLCVAESNRYHPQQTLQRIRQAHGEAAVVAVEAQLRAFLALAKYRTASSLEVNEKCHFALDFMDYTHFTSPIRRYPDLMVHRCLAALINGDPKPPLTPEAVEEICNACNDVNKHMREADKACSLAMLNIYLCQRKELFPTIGIVLTLKKSSMAVFLPEIDAENKVYFRGIDSKRIPDTLRRELLQPQGMQNSDLEATFVWPPQPDCPEITQTVVINEVVPLLLVPLAEIPATFGAVLIHPKSPQATELLAKAAAIMDKFLA
ncbi:RNB-like protein domain-containing protein [Cyclospora cayetanensis]|uniref:RNB-like protein domain-containing protein n=1 Tax=Cyclospora cayetanensis TaxID=88456 RepID=A0A1D3CYS3_9EIME|nr:RNB-like protein domain-containing protein [Cyclospora cayetanensis]